MKITKKTWLIFGGVILGVAVSLFGFFITFKQTDIHVDVLDGGGDCVFLMHGILRPSSVMGELAENFYTAGYKTINVDYPSTTYNIDTLTQMTLLTLVPEYCADQTVNFVGHSMGGIIIRNYLASNEVANLGSVVTIATPHKGSEVADFLNKFWVTRQLLGPALSDLMTGENSFTTALPTPDYELGAIVGTRSFIPFFSYLLPGPDDGEVSVESAKLEGAKDFIELPHSHTFITGARDTREEALKFIEFGEF